MGYAGLQGHGRAQARRTSRCVARVYAVCGVGGMGGCQRGGVVRGVVGQDGWKGGDEWRFCRGGK
eukprot:scaffold26862_cov90-Isochrysis_galbana.AAC.1